MPDTPDPQATALFRYGLIAEFIHLPAGHAGLHALLRAKAAQDYTIPGTTRCRVAPETLRHWLKAWRRGGFDALRPKTRQDRGRSRALPQKLADALLTLKEEQPHLSVPQLIAAINRSPSSPVVMTDEVADDGARSAANVSGNVPISVVTDGALVAPSPMALSTVHRLLSRAGLIGKHARSTDLTAQAATEAQRRKFNFAHPGQLWMSDVMHGPSVLMPDSRIRRKTYLIAFLDDATRLVPYCAFCLSESTQAFLPVFKQALLRRGLPQRLYVDNGANYRSHQLALICARMGVALIHARPYQPQGKGKQERWFRTVRAQLLANLKPSDTDSLEQLNRRLWAWVEGEYHHSPHRGLDGSTPLERWALSSTNGAPLPRLAGSGSGLDLDDLFLLDSKRRVQRDHTVSLNGTLLEIDAALVGHTVTLRHDPSVPLSRGVQVWFEGKFIEQARVLDAYANCFVRRDHNTKNIDTKNIQPHTAAESPSHPPRTTRMSLRDLHELQPKSADIKSPNTKSTDPKSDDKEPS